MTIERILYEAHSGWRYLVILVAVLAFVKLLIGLVSRGRWSGLDQGLARAFPIILDIQVLLGLVLWIAQRRWTNAQVLPTWEHPITMLIAVAIAHITWSQIRKRGDSSDKFRIGVIGYAVSGLVLALGILRITRVIGPIY